MPPPSSPHTASGRSLAAASRPRDGLAPGTLVFDTARADHAAARSFVLTDPREVIVAWAPDEVAPAIASAEAANRAGAWVGGLLAYEAGAPLVGVEAGKAQGGVPLVWFGVYDGVAAGVEAWPEPADLPAWTPGLAEAEYVERHERVRALIHEGDVYQINLTFPVDAASDAAPLALYAALRARQPVPYGAVLALSEASGAPLATVLSLSPELFFRLDAGRMLETRPMKGTVPRGATPAEDAAFRDGLVSDPKNRAENLMIVDLLRNDLSRVCTPGSVVVPSLFDTEAHPTLTQMTSTVTGRLRPDAGLSDVFAALYPSGSITGAPKRRAMERIASLEDSPRGAYCGAIGYLAPDGSAVFSVAIRTVTASGDRLTAGVGSGVTYDSVAADEYRECLLKSSFLGPLAP